MPVEGTPPKVVAETTVANGEGGHISSRGYAKPDETNAWLKARKRARRTAEIGLDPDDDTVVPCVECGDRAVTTYQRESYVCRGCQ
jgi:hypothetical protein